MMFWIAVISIYSLMSLVTAGFYALDKHRAISGGWRIPEKTLHTLELIGGWPGALVAQRVLHHKRRKTPYMVVFAGIVLLHVLIWVAVVFMFIRVNT